MSDRAVPVSWSRFLRTFFGALAFGVCCVYAAIFVIDPYDSGRLTPLNVHGIPGAMPPTYMAASRGRDPAYDSALIGNSTIQLIQPARLDKLDAPRRFVQLSVPGSGPSEQLAIIDWFARHHDHHPAAVVIGIDHHSDGRWCRAGVGPSRTDLRNPFPFWLYDRDTLPYVGNMLRTSTANAALYRLVVLLGKRPPAARDGYDDYDTTRVYDAEAARNRIRAHIPPPSSDADAPAPPQPIPQSFPSIDALRAALAGEFSPATRKIVVLLPVNAATIPTLGSVRGRELVGCRRALHELAAAVPNTVFLDFMIDTPLTREDDLFWDDVHYRQPIAQLLEAAIARADAGEDPQTAVVEGMKPRR